MSVVIGLVGEKGGGKETFGKLLTAMAVPKTARVVRFSDTLSDVLDILALERTRRNLQHLAVVIDEGFGKGTFTNAVKQRLLKETADIVFLDGVRWPTDYEMLTSLPNSLLVYVTADPKTRFERLRARKEKTGEANTTWEQFMAEEQAENERYIPQIGAKADFTIKNEGTLEEFNANVAEFYKKYIPS